VSRPPRRLSGSEKHINPGVSFIERLRYLSPNG
jgi:hypothetical protein